MEKFLTVLLYIDAIVMVVAILLQNRGTGLSATFGGEGGVFREKRGPEKLLHIVSVVTAVIFFLLALFLPVAGRIFG